MIIVLVMDLMFAIKTLRVIYQKSVIIHFSLVKYQLLVRNTSSVEDMILIYMDQFPVRTLNQGRDKAKENFLRKE